MPSFARLRRRIWLWGAFGILVAFATFGALFEHASSRTAADATADIVDDALASVELLDRIAVDVEREARLVSEHIFEDHPGHLATLEAQLASAQRDRLAAAKAYAALAIYPGEAAAWSTLEQDLASLDAPIANALESSRQHRDGDAFAALHRLAPTFDRIDSDLADAIRINTRHAARARTDVTALADHAARVRWLLWLASIAATGAIGATVIRRVTADGRRATALLELLEARNRELDAFAGRIAHDLRGPLASIALSGDVLGDRALPPERHARATRTLANATAQMDAMIGDLLALAHVDGQAVDCCDPSDAIRDAVAALEPRARAADAELRVSVEQAPIQCGRGLLRQAVTNLVDNALKYRKPTLAPIVSIVGRVRDRVYELRVSDNGLGMRPEDAAHAFEPLFRAPATRTLPGTGLGLAIVKRVADAFGGSARIESVAGRGSTFVLVFPLAAAPPARA